MQVMIEGHDLPGASFVSAGVPLGNVHVAVQVGREPFGPVRGDTDRAHWELDVRAVVDDGGIELRGPAIHGARGARFMYLTWGDIGTDGTFAMFRRAKLMVADIDADVLASVVESDGVLVGSLGLTDERGGPRCARVRPPTITWRAG